MINYFYVYMYITFNHDDLFCLDSVGSVNDDIVYNILLHEMSHAFGFTSTAMKTL